jgi:hypothetical protein
MHRPSEPESLRLGGNDEDTPCTCSCTTSVREGAQRPQSNQAILFNADRFIKGGEPTE